jgi:hypothetical protein
MSNLQNPPSSGVGAFTHAAPFVSVPSSGDLPSGTAPNTTGVRGVWLRLTLPVGATVYQGWADFRIQRTTI